jgi:hypothetical protein
MSPSNRHYVEALRGYLGDDVAPKSGIVVRDSNGSDLFAQTLEKNLQQQMEKMIGFPTQSYTGTGVPTEGVQPHLFATARNNICAAASNGLRTVLYAGREIDLSAFLDSLEGRPCPDAELTILTAGLDLGGILREWEHDREHRLRDAKLTIVSAGTVDAEGWGKGTEGTPEGYDSFLSAFLGHDSDVGIQGFDPGYLDGANSIMMHDALLAAAKAVRLAVPKAGESHSAAGVRSQLLSLNSESGAVWGAGGTVHFSADAPRGYPVGKPIPVLQYPHPANNSSRQVGPLYYVKYAEK